MTTTTETKKARSSRRAAVPAVDQASSSTSALDALAAAPTTGEVVMLPVATLHPHPRNPRRDLGDLTELADSIRAHGLRQSLLVVPDPDHPGEHRIVIGHRRRGASELAGRTHVPAVIDPDLDEAGQLELMLLENIQRADLTPVEEADGYQGLLDLGLDVAAIAKRTGRSAVTVRNRLKIVGLPEPVRQKVHIHQATIEDALALADFDGPDDLRERLIDALGQPDFAHVLEWVRREARDRAEIARIRAELEAAGVRVVEAGEYGTQPRGFESLWYLRSPSSTPEQAKPMTREEHADCPGAVAYVTARYTGAEAVFGCDNPRKYGHAKRYAPARPEPSPEERGEVIANNKAAAAAEVVRRQWIRDLLKRPKMPSGAAEYVARIITPSGHPVHPEHMIATDLLYGDRAASADDVDADRSRHGMRHLVALAAARAEAAMPRDFWRRPHERAPRIHLEQLVAWGYELAEIERTYLEKARG